MAIKTGLKARKVSDKNVNVTIQEVFEHEYCSNVLALAAAIAAGYERLDVFKARSKMVKDRNGDDLEITTHYLTKEGYELLCTDLGLEFEDEK